MSPAFFFVQFCKREGLPAKLADSIFIYGALATIIGARLGHCLFYEPDYFLSHPVEMLLPIKETANPERWTSWPRLRWARAAPRC